MISKLNIVQNCYAHLKETNGVGVSANIKLQLEYMNIPTDVKYLKENIVRILEYLEVLIKRYRTDIEFSFGKTTKKKLPSLNNIGLTGLTLEPNEVVYIQNKGPNGGILKARNTSNDRVHFTPSKKLLVKYDMKIASRSGDNKVGHLPVFWDEERVVFTVVKPNKDLLESGTRELPRNILNRIITEELTMNELVKIVPANPGSESKQNLMTNYLGYRRGVMYKMTSRRVDSPPEGVFCMDIETGRTTTHGPCIYIQGAIMKKDVCFKYDETKDTHYQRQCEPKLERFLSSIGSSGMVSLLQKIIRRKVKLLKHPDFEKVFYKPEQVIHSIIDKMLDPNQTGIFIPYPGAYISAQQHLLKRLMVISAEDVEYNHQHANIFGAGSLLTQKLPYWKPSLKLRNIWKQTAIQMWKSTKASVYRNDIENKPVSLNEKTASCLILYELGGMMGDKNMFSYLIQHPTKTVCMQDNKSSTESFTTLDIYMDQHVEARVVWMLKSKNTTRPEQYIQLLSNFFKKYTGQNPRRGHSMNIPSDLFKVQRETSLLYRKKINVTHPSKLDNIDEKYKRTISFQIPDGFLASEVGQIKMNIGRKKVLVTVSPIDLSTFIVIPNPSRNLKYEEVKDDIKKKALKIMETKCVSGIQKKGNTFKFDLKTREWSVNGIPWERFRNKSQKIIDFSAVNQIPKVTKEIFLQTCVILNGYNKTIHLPRMNREGQHTKEVLTGWEGHMYRFMIELSNIYPDALWPSGLFTFHTNHIHHRLELRKKLIALCSQSEEYKREFPCPSDVRKLLDAQRKAKEKMLMSHEKKMGSFLWMLVGSGKTLTVLHYLNETLMSNQINRIVWSAPSSAMWSLSQEIKKFGWKSVVMVPTHQKAMEYKKIGFEVTTDRNIQKGIITIVEHDNIRDLAADFMGQIMHCSFVYDEVHKAMSASTKRTVFALKLARLARQLVCLTGTPIVKSSAYPLARWLNLCVEFDVTFNNFWVAANSMAIMIKNTHVKTYHDEKKINFTVDERIRVNQYLPQAMGGTVNDRSEIDFRKAYTETRHIIDKHMINFSYKLVYGPRKELPLNRINRINYKNDHEYAVEVTKQTKPSLDVLLHLPQRVLLVGENKQHCQILIEKLLEKKVSPLDIISIGGNTAPHQKVKHYKTIYLSSEQAKNNEDGAHLPKICVASLQYPEGYTLTWMTTMVTGVYPSNQAKRTQMEGRINRISCETSHRYYFTFMGGLTEYMYKNHLTAKTLETTLKYM